MFTFLLFSIFFCPKFANVDNVDNSVNNYFWAFFEHSLFTLSVSEKIVFFYALYFKTLCVHFICFEVKNVLQFGRALLVPILKNETFISYKVHL